MLFRTAAANKLLAAALASNAALRDRLSRTIRVDRQMSRKATGEQVIFVEPKTEASTRTIQVADVVLDSVTQHVEQYGTHKSGLILTSEIGSPVRTSTLQRAWKIAARR